MKQYLNHEKFDLVYRVGISAPPIPDHTSVQGPGGIWVPVIPRDFIVGEIGAIARDRNIASIAIPGYWIHKDEKVLLEIPPAPGEKVIYFLHGGGYVEGTAHPDGEASKIVKGFLRNSSSRSLRRTLAGYLHLIKLGFPEENVIVVGDSAGGNLALALTRYLLLNKKEQPKLPKVPTALVLLSPWSDLSEQFNGPDPHSSRVKNADRDWLQPVGSGVIDNETKAFLGGRPEHVELAYRNPYISPASPVVLGSTPDSSRIISFKGFPRTFIDNGTFDTLYDQVLRLRDAMAEDLGKGAVVYNEVAGVPHDYLFIDWCDPDRTETSKKILKWLGL